jgi:hypothetical protein
MAKQKDPNEQIAVLEARLTEMHAERSIIAGTSEDHELVDQSLAEAVLASDSDTADLIRERRKARVQELADLDGEIAIVARELATAREDAARIVQRKHRDAAWAAANARAQVAAEFDAALATAGKLWDELERLTEAESAELRAAGDGAGTATTLTNRLHFIVPSVLWKHLPKMMAAARLERINGARWQTLASFLAVLPRKNVDAA